MKEKHKKAIIIILALLLVISFRLPITPHELGQDSYASHFRAESILEEGNAKWIVSPFSIFGLYNYSYPAGGLYLLAIVSSLININFEWTIFILSIIFGIIGFFGAYLLASQINNKFYFKLTTATFFSILPISIKFTSWTYSTRGLFIMLIPFFIWCLIKSYKNKKFMFFAILIFLLLCTIHRMYSLILLLIFSFLLNIIMYKYINKPERKKIRLGLILFSFITALFYLLYIKAFWAYRYLPDVLRIGPRVITDLIALTYILFARLGIILPMAFLGIFLIYFYRNKKIDYKLNFLVITFLVFIPFLRNSMYFYQCISVIFVILSIVALDIIIEKYKTHSKLIIACFYIIIIMFSMFTIYVRINGSNYMKTSLYETAEYINQDISSYEAIGGVDVRKIRTVLTSPTIDKLGADYYIVDRIDLETEKELKDFPTTPSELASFIKYPFKEIKIIESSGENIFDVEFNLNNIEEDQNKIYANDDYMVIKK